MAYGLLKGKTGIISGALNEKSIAWKVALKAHEEGAKIVLTNAPIAMRMGEINKLAESCEAPIIAADATSVEDIEQLQFEYAVDSDGDGSIDSFSSAPAIWSDVIGARLWLLARSTSVSRNAADATKFQLSADTTVDIPAASSNLKRRVWRARTFPTNTCAASRHVHIIADQLSRGTVPHILLDEPQHCAESMLSVLESLWKARTELRKLRGQ